MVTRALLGGEVFTNADARTNWVTDWKDIQPRFGFSYLLDTKTVVRGGYGIYYDQTRSGANGLLSYGSQGFNQYTNAVTTYNNDGATPYLHLSNPFPNGLIAPPGSSLGLLNDVGYGAIGPLRTVAAAKTPYEQSWSFGIQRELGWNTMLDLEYVGKKGIRLYLADGNNFDIFGPQIENMSPAQIGNLGNYVTNPFAPLLTGSYYANSALSSPTVQAFRNYQRITRGRNRSTIPQFMTPTWPGWEVMVPTRESLCRIRIKDGWNAASRRSTSLPN